MMWNISDDQRPNIRMKLWCDVFKEGLFAMADPMAEWDFITGQADDAVTAFDERFYTKKELD